MCKCHVFVLAIAGALSSSLVAADKAHYTLVGNVVRIADGDTLTVLDSTNVQLEVLVCRGCREAADGG
jgi:hypothetical protein